MKHIKPVNEFFYFLKKDKYKYYKDLAKEFNLTYKEVGERQIILGPKNGHEIEILIGADSCKVTVSYYGSIYKTTMVKDIEKYLRDFNFINKPNIEHKYKYTAQIAPKSKRDKNKDDVFSIMTKELKDRTKGPTSMAHAYLLTFDNDIELEKFNKKYPIGGKYKGETITNTTTLRSKDIHFGE
jgi:hypothetical protein